MTRFDDLDRALGAYLDQEAAAPAPAFLLADSLAATSRRRPRPQWQARITATRHAGSGSGSSRLALVAVGMAVVLLGLLLAGLIVGSPRPPSPLVDVPPLPTASSAARTPSASSPGTSPVATPFPVAAGEPWIAYMTQIGAENTDRIWLVRPDGSDRHELETGLDGQQEHPDWSPDGTRIAFDHHSPNPTSEIYDLVDIWVMDADGSNARRVAGCEAPCYQLAYPSWSPDGTQLVVSEFDELVGTAWGPSAIEVIDIETGDRRVVYRSADGTQAFHNPRWSPDGSGIVFAIQTFSDVTEAELLSTTLAVVRADGTDVVPSVITPPELEAEEPDWHPTDDRIAFRTHFDPVDPVERARPTEIYTVLPDGSRLTNLTSFGLGIERGIQPSWTPDGTQVVFTVVDGFGGAQIPAVALMDGDGGNITRLGFGTGTAGRLRPTP